jgi:hypothetical protein
MSARRRQPETFLSAQPRRLRLDAVAQRSLQTRRETEAATRRSQLTLINAGRDHAVVRLRPA